MGVAGLAFAGVVWCALFVVPYETRRVELSIERKYLRPQILGGPSYRTTPGLVVWTRVASARNEERWEAQERREGRKVARLNRIQLPVETPVEPSLVAVR